MTPRQSIGVAGDLARAVLAHARATQVTFMAAALAYYGFLSVVPLVVLGVVVASVVGGEALAAALLGVVGQALTPSGEALLRSAIVSGTGRGGVTILGLVLLVWGSLRGFRGFDRAFSLVYGSAVEKSLPAAIVDAAVVMLGVGAAGVLLAVVTAAAVAERLPDALAPVALLVTLFVVFLPVYYRFPDVETSVRAVVPGAALAAVGWTLLGAIFQLYAAEVADPTLYGLLGGVLLVLTWFYLAALVMLLGAVVNAVRRDRRDR